MARGNQVEDEEEVEEDDSFNLRSHYFNLWMDCEFASHQAAMVRPLDLKSVILADHSCSFCCLSMR